MYRDEKHRDDSTEWAAISDNPYPSPSPYPFTLTLPFPLLFYPYPYPSPYRHERKSGCNVVLNDKKYFIPVFYTNTFISDNCYNGKKNTFFRCFR